MLSDAGEIVIDLFFDTLAIKSTKPADKAFLVCSVEFSCHDALFVDFYTDFAQRAAGALKMPCSGRIPRETIKERWTVPRASFVYHKAQDQFERRTHRRAINIYNTSPETLNIWLAYIYRRAPSFVKFKTQLVVYEDMDCSKSMEKLENEFNDLRAK